MNAQTAFDSRVQNVPQEWRGPLVEVMDTFECVSIYFQSEGNEKLYSPELALGLTRLIIELHAKEFDVALSAAEHATN